MTNWKMYSAVIEMTRRKENVREIDFKVVIDEANKTNLMR